MNFYSLISLVILGGIIYFVYKRSKSINHTGTLSNHFGPQIDKIISDNIPNEDVIFKSWAMDKASENKGLSRSVLRYQITKSTTSDFKYYDYYIVAKTNEHIYFIPIKIRGMMNIEMQEDKNRKQEKYPLSSTKTNVKSSDTNSVTVNFSFENEGEKTLYLYDNLDAWNLINN